MTNFIQLHLLTNYGPSNLNRDDLGRPKTVVLGGAQRLRISSQSLKRAWRTSADFERDMQGHIGTRTKEMGTRVERKLLDGGVDAKKARKWAQEIAGVFGKLKGEDSLDIEQLAHFTPAEEEAIDVLIARLVEERRAPIADELQLLRHDHGAVDVAMFGRMLASNPGYNAEAAIQVAHAHTVHRVAVEDDYFTAVDDLNSGIEDSGAAHLGTTEFGAGLFYSYLCINRDLLVSNLSGDAELATRALAALVRAVATVAPTGKQASFASRAAASFIMAESGIGQPRSLSVAFLKPIGGSDYLADSIDRLRETREQMERAYGNTGSCAIMDVPAGAGSLSSIVDFVSA